ncbi:ABC transporter permease subunit [Catenulispora sp. NF23]|uniref:ABC transporter permease subunit n=1 Tax=Catenulispora pinistramenti TaxID=2705254 RepID=A0ABS5L3N5_9ACTN|nr:ABC transporter permease subunit [Catenulispora pinistramenti]MBS2537113.1 ABC transporter permease subunit [Catenulispora pinistramenti]MBS2552972.1 ABC transporter permease subunit [Catenulispora pinistramenti]
MTAVVSDPTGTQSPATRRPAAGRTRRRQPRIGRTILLLLFAAYFFVPLYAAVDFTLGGSRRNMGHTLSVWTGLVHQDGFTTNLMTSLKIAVGTVALLMILMVPTMAWLHLRLPHMRRIVEGICLLPMAIPAVVIANGILGAFKSWPQAITGSSWILILEYVILALPFTYRSLDAGLSAIPLATLVEAARSLGASWPTTLWRVVVPNIRTAIASAGILGAALALGEFTIAHLLLLNTFPVWTDQAGQQDGEVATTAAMLILFLSWLLLMLVSQFARGRTAKKPPKLRREK